MHLCTYELKRIIELFFRNIAQLVESWIPNPKVVGSNPAIPAKKIIGIGKKLKNNYIKSPLNYTGGKHKLLIQILPLFPTKINTFVDLFCGGCNVGINVDANKIIFNDNLTYLIEVLEAFKNNSTEYTLNHIDKRIEEFQLSMTNETGYKDFKKYYNENRIPLDLFVLIAYSFNNQFRFNTSHEYNTTFGRN